MTPVIVALYDEFAVAERVRTAITVHPRTDYEMDSARAILQSNHPADFREHTSTT